MKTKYIPSFGVEIHAELLTKTKAFSPALVSTNASSNININSIDLGYPGAKPTVNKKVVEHAYRLAKALNMNIQPTLYFDRKNYFYPDLAKGFQITQFFKPIGSNGYLKIFDKEGKTKNINVLEIHIEEDTAKQTKIGNKIVYDFNRAGIGLIEIVSDFKQFESIDDVINYVEQMRELLLFLGICNGKMNEGSFRVDINVSVRKENSSEFGTRVEIKNLNSFNFIRKALEYEINEQIEKLEKQEEIICVTKKYDEKTNTTKTMRLKNTETDYNYFAETNINPISIEKFINDEFIKIPSVLTYEIREKYLNVLTQENLSTLFNNYELAIMFFLVVKINNLPKESFNFIFQTFLGIINETKKTYRDFNINEKNVVEIIKLLSENKITKNEVNELLKNTLEKKFNIISKISEYNNVKQINSQEIEKMIETILSNNPQILNEHYDRKMKFIMGEIMKQTKGKVNMKLANEIANLKLK